MPGKDYPYEKGTNILVWRVGPDLKAKFKAKCAAEKRSIKEVIIELMTEYVKRK